MSSQDWLDLMSGERSVWALLRANRVTVTGDEGMGIIYELPYLGLLGPVDALKKPHPLWVYLHPVIASHPPHDLESFMPGRKLDYDRFRCFERGYNIMPRMWLLPLTAIVSVIMAWNLWGWPLIFPVSILFAGIMLLLL